MLELSLSSVLQDAASRIGAHIERLQRQWPKPILLSAADVSIYDCFPYLFGAAFPSVDPEDLDSFAVAARLYASSIFLYDKIFDQGAVRDLHADLAPVNAMRIMAMQWEAYRLLHGLFSPGSVFWNHFQTYVSEFTAARLEEERFAAGRPWKELSEELALEIAKGKNGIARTTIAGLCEMARNPGVLQSLTEAIDCYNCARQLWDDLVDWREDLTARVPSLVLVRIVGKAPDNLDGEQLKHMEAEVGREVFYGGHAAFTLQLALSHLERADATLALWPKLAWRKMHEELRQECQLMLADIDRIVSENIQRIQRQPEFHLVLPAPGNEWQRLAWPALEYIIDQWRQGFGEARHVMRFPAEGGFSGPEYQRGDIFQRALIGCCLCDAREQWKIDFGTVIEEEIRHVLSRRGTARGGWRYFPDLAELPPDADDLAQIIQLLWRSGKGEELSELWAGPLAVLLEDNGHADGSFETWIIPKCGRTSEEERQAQFAREMWGTGADPDVMANLLYALVLIDSGCYSDKIQRGVAYLLSEQSPSGWWESTWYHGPYYGTFVCLRLLCHVAPAGESIRRAAMFLRTSQNADGGWGNGGWSNDLDTALALLGLAHVQDSGCAEGGDLEVAARGLAYLQTTADRDGSWSEHEFIRMDTGRASGSGGPVVSYGSRTITTMFAIQAMCMWDGVRAERSSGARS